VSERRASILDYGGPPPLCVARPAVKEQQRAAAPKPRGNSRSTFQLWRQFY